MNYFIFFMLKKIQIEILRKNHYLSKSRKFFIKQKLALNLIKNNNNLIFLF